VSGVLPEPGAARPTPSSALTRVVAAAAIGFGVGIVAGLVAAWQLATLLAWVAAGGVFLGWAWGSVRGLGPGETASHATREDNSRVMSQLLLLGASVASLAGVAAALVKASHSHGAEEVWLIAASVATVVVSWALVHTVYALRYAHLYYSPAVGGIDFKSDDAPDYRDFAYVAFTVGMTFQVSDTDIQKREIRRTVLRQAFLAYLFGAVILAVTVNVIASLLR
jgi:uncharacterized membrane protein